MNRKITFFSYVCSLLILTIALPITLQYRGNSQTSIEQFFRVHNLDTGLNYTAIQEAINANETLDGHTILLEDGNYTLQYPQGVIINKSIALVGQNPISTMVIGNHSSPVIEVLANSVTIANLTVMETLATGELISLANVDDCIIIGNRLIGERVFEIGASCYNCTNCTIVRNSVFKAGYSGMNLELCTRCRITENRIEMCYWHGLSLSYCNNCLLSNNSVTETPIGGLAARHSQNCSIVSNTAVNSSLLMAWCSNCVMIRNLNPPGKNCGTQVNWCVNCTIAGNLISGYRKYTYSGMHLSNCCRFYHNNIVDTSFRFTDVSNIILDDNSEGNYWILYNGIDGNDDGIGDLPYTINGIMDHYPLMGMFNAFNTSLSKIVNVISNSTVEDFQYFESNNTIRMRVSNMTANQTHGFCRVCIPRALISEPYNVTVDGATPTYWNYTIYDNGTHKWIYFAYEHSTLEIVIIPELPTFLFLPLFLIITVLTYIAYSRKKSLLYCRYKPS